jgi:hypothetical protein
MARCQWGLLPEHPLVPDDAAARHVGAHAQAFPDGPVGMALLAQLIGERIEIGTASAGHGSAQKRRRMRMHPPPPLGLGPAEEETASQTQHDDSARELLNLGSLKLNGIVNPG